MTSSSSTPIPATPAGNNGNQWTQMTKSESVFSQPPRQLNAAEETEKNNFNLLFSLPTDVVPNVLSYLPEKDASSYALVCRDIHTMVQIVRQSRRLPTISETVALARAFDDQIRTLTNNKHGIIKTSNSNNTTMGFYTFFKFDVEKWIATANESHTPANPQEAKELEYKAKEAEWNCGLDLIEALAEFNRDSRIFFEDFDDDGLEEFQFNLAPKYPSQCRLTELEKNRFINQLIPPTEVDEKSILRISNKILEEAKHTLKGDVFIVNKMRLNPDDRESHVMLREKVGDKNGPYFDVWMTNPENGNWDSHKYYRHTRKVQLTKRTLVVSRGKHIHYDWLADKKEGDRLVIPSDDANEQVILRCLHRTYKYQHQGNFEDVVHHTD